MQPELLEWLARPGGLGEQLRDLRSSAGLKGTELAAELDLPRTRISKIENGKALPREDEVRSWVAACNAGHTLADLLALRQEGQAIQLRTRGRVSAYTADRRLRDQAASILVYGPDLFPGPVQTIEYAIATIQLFETQRGTTMSEATAARIAAARIGFWESVDVPVSVLFHQAATRLPIGGSTVLAAQVDRVAELAATRRATIGVVPDSDPAAALPVLPFTVYTDSAGLDAIVVEDLVAPIVHEAAEPVGVYRAIVDHLSGLAVHGADAADLLKP